MLAVSLSGKLLGLHTRMLTGSGLYCSLLFENMANILKTVQTDSLKCFFFSEIVVERLMEDDSSQYDRRFFLPIKSPFHRRPISWGLAGLANRELWWWQGCGQPRLSLPFNESSLVPSPITNLPAPWWIIIWEEKTSLCWMPTDSAQISLCDGRSL